MSPAHRRQLVDLLEALEIEAPDVLAALRVRARETERTREAIDALDVPGLLLALDPRSR